MIDIHTQLTSMMILAKNEIIVRNDTLTAEKSSSGKILPFGRKAQQRKPINLDKPIS